MKLTLSFLSSRFVTWPKKLTQKLKYLQNKKSCLELSITFKGLSAVKNCLRPDSAPLILWYIKMFLCILNWLSYVTAKHVLRILPWELCLQYSHCSFLRIWSHLLKKSLMENFIFCAMSIKKRFHQSLLRPKPWQPRSKCCFSCVIK